MIVDCLGGQLACQEKLLVRFCFIRVEYRIGCHLKDQGGLGITHFGIKKKCFLSEWFFGLLRNEEGRPSLLRNKYRSAKCLSQVQIKPGDSQF